MVYLKKIHPHLIFNAVVIKGEQCYARRNNLIDFSPGENN